MDVVVKLAFKNLSLPAIKSEKIDVEAFIRLVVEIRQAIDPEAAFREAFAAFDADGDGFLTAKELKAVYIMFIFLVIIIVLQAYSLL